MDAMLMNRRDAITAAPDGDAFNVALLKSTLAIIKYRRQSSRATYKQNIRRLLRQEQRLHEVESGQTPTVASSMEALTLPKGHGGTPMQRVRKVIADCIREAAKQRRRFLEGGHPRGKS